MIQRDSTLCKNCHGVIQVEADISELDKNEMCSSVRVAVKCPTCEKKYIATCWFDYVRGNWHGDGITLSLEGI